MYTNSVFISLEIYFSVAMLVTFSKLMDKGDPSSPFVVVIGASFAALAGVSIVDFIKDWKKLNKINS